MRFSIVTASFRQLELLKCCARSVADQGVDLEHIIQDGGTGPELENWVREQTRAKLVMEADAGMYDALNRGFSRGQGEILAWLNCDEQYLPGALRAVEERFAAEPDLDVLLADNLVVDREGKYLAHRFSLVPTLAQMWVRFPVGSCAMFFRRRVWRPFDTRWKSVGDWWWFREIVEQRARVDVLRRFVSVFTETRENLGLAPISAGEHAQIRAARPWWARVGRPLLVAHHRLRMWQSGAFAVKPFHYAIYPPAGEKQPGGSNSAANSADVLCPVERQEFFVSRPTGRWIRPA